YVTSDVAPFFLKIASQCLKASRHNPYYIRAKCGSKRSGSPRLLIGKPPLRQVCLSLLCLHDSCIVQDSSFAAESRRHRDTQRQNASPSLEGQPTTKRSQNEHESNPHNTHHTIDASPSSPLQIVNSIKSINSISVPSLLLEAHSVPVQSYFDTSVGRNTCSVDGRNVSLASW